MNEMPLLISKFCKEQAQSRVFSSALTNNTNPLGILNFLIIHWLVKSRCSVFITGEVHYVLHTLHFSI